MQLDRRVARAAVALAAAVFAVTTAATLGVKVDGAVAPRDDPRSVARALLVLAHRADSRSYRVDYAVQRRLVDGRVLTATVTEWVRARPPLVVEQGSGTLNVVSDTGAWVCTTLDAGPQCLATSGTPSVEPAVTPYVVAIASGRYDVLRRPGRTIARHAVQCFALQRRAGTTAITDIGDELDVCFAADGVLLASRRTDGGNIDSRTATRVRRGVARRELVALAHAATDGSVTALPSR